MLNLALLALAGLLVWILRANWLEAQTRERAVLRRKLAGKPVLAPPASAVVKAAAPAEYSEVASKMLFSKDRNPNVVVEPPKPAPEPVMPALPNYHGQMAIGEPVILLSAANGLQRSYHAGEQIGDFRLLSFDDNAIAFEWKGKNVERKLEDLRPKQIVAQGASSAALATAPPSASAPVSPVASLDRPASAATPAASAGFAAAPPPSQGVTSLSAAKAGNGNAADTSGDSTFGPLLPSGDRSCVNSDNSPVGSVHSGYIKVQSMGIFGGSCSWTEVK